MDAIEAIKNRHSVRKYTEQKIEGDTLEKLRQAVDEANRDGGLNIQLCIDEPKGFSGGGIRYGAFKNANNYIAMIGRSSPDLEEKCGYYGEQLVIAAQQLGLNSCWVGMFKKSNAAVQLGTDEKMVLAIAIGYGEDQGSERKTKPMEKLCTVTGEMPPWFKEGMEAAKLAPTAMNQQKFKFHLDGEKVTATAGSGFFSRVDLGIAKCHFELGSGRRVF